MGFAEYVVTPRNGAWTIRFSGRHFDQFATESEALERALEWAANARRQGHSVAVLAESEQGEVRVVNENKTRRAA